MPPLKQKLLQAHRGSYPPKSHKCSRLERTLKDKTDLDRTFVLLSQKLQRLRLENQALATDAARASNLKRKLRSVLQENERLRQPAQPVLNAAMATLRHQLEQLL